MEMMKFLTRSPWVKSIYLGLLGVFAVVQIANAKSEFPPPYNQNNSAVVKSYLPLIILDQNILGNSNFSLTKTLQSILRKGEVLPTDGQLESFFGSLLSTFGEKQFGHPDFPIAVDRIDGFESILTSKFLNPNSPHFLVPIAIVNRFDLAPEDYNNCGEYRIVYSFKPKKNDQDRPDIEHFSLIFEARVMNSAAKSPSIETRKRECRRIAINWSKYKTLERTDIIDTLSSFFYGRINSREIRAISPENLGMLRGQIRGNVNASNKWNLREWNVTNTNLVRSISRRSNARTSALDYSIEAVSIKESPNVQYYLDFNSDDNLEHRTRHKKLKKLFQNKFVSDYVTKLIDSIKHATSEIDVIGNLGATSPNPEASYPNVAAFFDNKFNDFDGISSPKTEQITTKKAPKLSKRIQNAIPKDLPNELIVTNEHILAMAQTLSCAGCHGFSSRTPILSYKYLPADSPLKWPLHHTFVHITEPKERAGDVPSAGLSRALSRYFLPFRKKKFDRFVSDSEAITKSPQLNVAVVKNRIIRKLSSDALSQRILEFSQTNRKANRSTQRAQILLDVKIFRDESKAKAGAFVTNRRTH